MPLSKEKKTLLMQIRGRCSFLADAPSQAESLLHSLEQVAKSISLYVNSEKTEFLYFNQCSVISSLNDMPLNLVDIPR